MKRYLLISTLTLLLSSCDPVKNVLISNHTNTDVKVRILQGSTQQLSLGALARNGFALTKSGDGSFTRISYGLGVFSRKELKSFNLTIKQIEIKTVSDECTIIGDELRLYLPKKRLGLFNNIIEVKIKNCP